MSSFAVFSVVWHISVHSKLCILSPFLTISRRFFTRTWDGHDIVDLIGLVVALATLVAILCMWCFHSWCQCHLDIIVSRISIRVGIFDLLWSYLRSIYF